MAWLEYVLDPLVLLFVLVVVIVLAGTVICVVAVFARNANDDRERIERWAIIGKYEARSHQQDEDYKALVESYLRETGKVYVRPAQVNPPVNLAPPQPNPFRFKPPQWAVPPSMAHDPTKPRKSVPDNEDD